MTVQPKRHTMVKVCGITRLEDGRAAVEAGADWLGFVIEHESPRALAAGAIAEILAELPNAVGVGVLVAPNPDRALRLAREAGVQRLQLHRVDPEQWPLDFPLPVVFALTVTAEGTLTTPLPPLDRLVMLDTADATLAGGTGRSFPWNAAMAIAAQRPIILAGGLDGDNVGVALEEIRPYGVDSSSRLESAPGIKDHERVRQFVAAVRRADARLGAGI
ncbi:MAG TPA: phosphoribosylanthranilate isomerase [Candidatus Limnocylindria bacterium]|nr:phosphoribosylanthranilate isomerase [Candidatus Limnocylindria bacterium]